MSPREHELSEQLFGAPQQQSMGALEAVKEAFLTIAPGLKDLVSESKEQLSFMGDLGRSELANALFGNGAFVLYSHEPQNDQGKDGPEQAHDDQQLERGGRSM